MKTVTAKLNYDEDEELDKLAKARYTSKAALIRLLIIKFLIEERKNDHSAR
jgi:hypothetical protein